MSLLRVMAVIATPMVLAALAAPAAAAPPEGQILNAGSTNVVAGSYIVVLKNTAVTGDGVIAKAGQLAARFGGRTGHVFRHALRGFEVSLSERNARMLADDPSVAYVQRNGIFTISDTEAPVPSWGLDRIDQTTLPLDNAYTYPATASGVKAYIIDTGIRFSHADFGGRAISGVDEIDGGAADDGYGHGTHVAATVGGNTYGVAKGVTLVAVRVLNASGTGSTAQITAGIDWVTGDHTAGQPAVANMSLGGTADPTLEAAIVNSIADGVTYTVSAGNNSTDACTASPARVPAAITVGATTSTDARASFSNLGSCVDIFAPGESITSAWNTSDTATNTISGTSMAAPHVAGEAALVLAQHPSFTPQQARDWLVGNATKNAVTDAGAGSPNALLFVGPVTDAFQVTQDEDYSSQSGTQLEASADAGGGSDVGHIAAGDWLRYGLNFGGSGAVSVTTRLASGSSVSGTVQYRLDSTTGPIIASVPVNNTGGWQNWVSVTTSLTAAATGVHPVFLTFTTTGPQDLVNLNRFQFS